MVLFHVFVLPLIYIVHVKMFLKVLLNCACENLFKTVVKGVHRNGLPLNSN